MCNVQWDVIYGNIRFFCENYRYYVHYFTWIGRGASIGDVQQMYEVIDEEGCNLNDSGEIEEYAYKYFREAE